MSDRSLTSSPSPVGHPPGDNNSGGQDTLSDGEYARKSRALMRLLRELRDLGADAVFDLPKIAVIGSQSAGKSSLIEAVTGINVPRDSGTCTRCPMECRMSSATTSWTCTISFRFNGEISAEDTNQLERFGPVIEDKGEVELWLRRAQAAILSVDPDKSRWESKSAQEIKQATQEGRGMLQFTNDAIVVDIQDQDATDLSFVDLPGLIQNSDQDSIDLIKNLAQEYIKGENTLILVTIPVSDDIQNQGAVVLAKQADERSRRTIGILTKPDILGPGAIGLHQIWQQTLENRPNNNPNYLQHGYYCVRLPDDEQRQNGHTAHDLPNPDYFDVTRPWSEVADRRRFGVNNVVRDVSALLVQLIEANLPRLHAAVEAALKECIIRLGQLPPLLQGEPLTNIMLLVNSFLRDLDTASVGDSHKPLAQTSRARYDDLRRRIFNTCPNFGLLGKGGAFADNEPVITYDIAAVRQVIQECTSWELPGFIPYDVYKTFIKRFLERWDKPVQSCFNEIAQIFSTFIEELSDHHFGHYRALKSFVSSHARAEFEKSKADTNASLQKLLDLERQPFFTQRSDFVTKQEEWERTYRQTFSPQTFMPSARQDPLSWKNHEENRNEIHVMATVRTYFQFVYERFADTTLLMQEYDLVKSFRSKLETSLINNLMDVQRRGGLEDLLAEDQNIERERQGVTEKREKLVVIRDTLDSFSLS